MNVLPLVPGKKTTTESWNRGVYTSQTVSTKEHGGSQNDYD
jgi:hypothetical protein